MTTGILTYNDYVAQIVQLGAIDSATNANLLVILPQMISYAENRICRDVDFMFTSTAVTAAMTANNRQIAIPAGTFVVSEQINVITPSSTTNPELGTRNPMLATTKEFLDAVYGSATTAGVPEYFVPFNDDLFLVGPFPDANYTVELVGTFRPASLSPSNQPTFISRYLPDLFLMASMIFMSGFQRDFGRQADDPQIAQSYENQYQLLLKGAALEEARKKFDAAAWSSQAPATAASPTRG